MTKRILVLCGNPKQKSLCHQLVEHYMQHAQQYFDVRHFDLAKMNFDANLGVGYDAKQPLEMVLQEFQEAITWAQHVVIIAPVWWGSIPAKLKGLFDRTFLPGFAFQYQQGKSIPQKLLQGKTASLFLTMDTPTWYYRWFQGAPAVKQLDIATLRFCGFSKAKTHLLGPVFQASEQKRQRWLELAARMGRRGS